MKRRQKTGVILLGRETAENQVYQNNQKITSQKKNLQLALNGT